MKVRAQSRTRVETANRRRHADLRAIRSARPCGIKLIPVGDKSLPARAAAARLTLALQPMFLKATDAIMDASIFGGGVEVRDDGTVRHVPLSEVYGRPARLPHAPG